MKKSILVTGAAGFIGFHFAKKSVELGHNVVALDNFNDYYDVALKQDRAKELGKLGVHVQNIDICDKEKLSSLFSAHDFSHVVHLAAQAGVRYSFVRPDLYIRSNIEGFLNILEALKGLSKKTRLIYASSSSVYGLNQTLPFKTADTTDSPSNVYAMTKKSNELMAFSYHHLYGIKSLGMRFFTVYGPWGRPDMAYFSFTKAICNGEPITVYGNGELLRDFTYIDDVIDALVNALGVDEEYALFNIGNSRPEPVRELIALVEKETKKSANIRYLPMQKGEIFATYADISESKKKLQFLPKTTLSEGVQKFVLWYRSYFKTI